MLIRSLSYDKATLDQDLDQTTGSFTGDYKQTLTEVVEPTARRRGISTEASVSAAGVVSVTATRSSYFSS
jgi:Mce-associated membrane protein